MKREEKKENEQEIRIRANKRREFGGRTKEKMRKEPEREKGRKRIERGRKGEKRKMDFPNVPMVESHRSESKVDPHNEGYAWVPKSRSFFKLQEVGNFPTWIIFSLKSI